MAPAPRSSAANDDATSQNGQFQPFKSWLAVYGDAEYAQYKKEAATPHLTYEDWASSDHPLGPYLYKLTLDAWDDESTSVSSHSEKTPSLSATYEGRTKN
jgi:hypothetical protein